MLLKILIMGLKSLQKWLSLMGVEKLKKSTIIGLKFVNYKIK